MQPKAAQRLAHATLETWRELSARLAEQQPADTALAQWWRRHPHFGARDRRFISETMFSAFRWKGWLDRLPPEEGPRLAVAYLLDADTPHPAADHLAGKFAGAPPAGHRDLDGKARWLTEHVHPTGTPGLTDLVPDWVESVLPPGTLETFIRGIQTRPPLWLRTRQGDAENVVPWLQARGFTARPHAHLPEALALDKAPPSDVLHQLARRGCTPQDLHAQMVVLAAQPRPGESWWDMCAGAGGKTLHLADLLQARGRILATDIRESALQELDRRARLMGIHNLTLRCLRPDADPPGGPFDGVIVDAPCSGLGTWGRNPDARWRTSLESVHRASATQHTLLKRAIPHVKRGGRIVYATCSVTTHEGDAIFLPALANQPLQPRPFTCPLTPDPATDHLTLWPNANQGIGMYIASATVR